MQKYTREWLKKNIPLRDLFRYDKTVEEFCMQIG